MLRGNGSTPNSNLNFNAKCGTYTRVTSFRGIKKLLVLVHLKIPKIYILKDFEYKTTRSPTEQNTKAKNFFITYKK